MSDRTSLFSQRLKSMRKFRGLSQTNLAKTCGFAPSYISHLECGSREPVLKNLVKISDGLNCSIDFLSGKADSHHIQKEYDDLYRNITNLSEENRESAMAFVDFLVREEQC